MMQRSIGARRAGHGQVGAGRGRLPAVGYRFRDAAGTEVARATTRHVALDAVHGRPTVLPEALGRVVDAAASG